MDQNTYTYTTVVENTKAVFDQIIIHCMKKKRDNSQQHATCSTGVNVILSTCFWAFSSA